MVQWTWLPGQGYSKVDPTIVGETITRLGAEGGGCSPHALVDAGRPEDSPLHPLFEWDDERAAEAYRVTQARLVIRSVRVVDEQTGTAQPAPAFVHVRQVTEDGVRDGYMATDAALSSPQTRAIVIGDALRQLSGLRHRYKTLTELGAVWEAVDQVTLGEEVVDAAA